MDFLVPIPISLRFLAFRIATVNRFAPGKKETENKICDESL